ncbi:MAG TPA: MAPEG family protein [Sphingomonadales bacterium]|nr:MAPEG family protein [Sphingomonadales bacterium]
MIILNQKQKDVRIGMIAGAVFSVVWVGMGYGFIDIDLPLWVTTGDRLAYVLKSEIYAALMLLFGIMAVAGQRFFSDQAIEGQTEGLPKAITINLRYIQNTMEQLVLMIIVHLAYAVTANSGDMKIIPILVSLFIVGRVCFWIGYHQNALSRAFGFAVTFYPTAVMMFVTLWHMGV